MEISKKRVEVEKETKRFAEMYLTSTYPEARKCYTQYVELLAEDLPKEDRYSVLNLWSKLTEER